MRIAVLGLWHLGSVCAAGSAAAGHEVHGWDPDSGTVDRLSQGIPPLFEPGLEQQVKSGIAAGRLSFTTDLAAAVREAEVVWIAFDTPVDEQDRADVGSVVAHVRAAFPFARQGAVILVSSQVPVGTGRSLESLAQSTGRADLHVACSPENLRLGQALAVFATPDRVVCGVRLPQAREALARLWEPITAKVEWMSVESAEMTKHAINAFLAMSVAFANEIAMACEAAGADAKEVERGLKTESRIGSKAYVGPGLAFAGGTLARDIEFLAQVAEQAGTPSLLFPGVRASNDRHKQWTVNKLAVVLGGLSGRTVALWGLAYKPGTDTLRRSSSLECAERLLEAGAVVRVHDPAVRALPPEWEQRLVLAADPVAAAAGADAVVLCTAWPEYREVPAKALAQAMRRALVVDPTRFLAGSLGGHGLEYMAIGLVNGGG